MANKLALTIIISIILTVIIVSTVNVGTSLFLDEPSYDDFCGNTRAVAPVLEKNDSLVCTQEVKECPDGTFVSRNPDLGCEFESCINPEKTCYDDYTDAQKPYNQTRFYIFAGLGFALLLVGLFWKENLIQITGLATGGILVFQGIVMNLENKLAVFLTLIGILIIFGVLAYRVINKKNEKEIKQNKNQVKNKINSKLKWKYILANGGKFGGFMFFFFILWDKFVRGYEINELTIIGYFFICTIAGLIVGFWSWKKKQE